MEWRPEFIAPLLSALAAGALIGYEREFRARAAGFRTHTLVAVASALLMLAAQHQIEWAGVAMTDDVMRIDPVRMAHGVLTGIGFLCGGVIWRAKAETPLSGDPVASLMKLIDALDDDDDVQNVWTNADIPDEDMAKYA